MDKHLDFSEFVLGLKMKVRKSENHNKKKIQKAQVCLKRTIWYNKRHANFLSKYYIFVLSETYHQVNETATYYSVS